MRQYLEQKAQVGEAILLFRMGDFYETFYDDAKTVSRVLGLALTSRNKGSAEPIPLAGVPYHAVDGYIARLVKAGYKVAISEQVEDPRQARGLVERRVERVITPGTLTDDVLLDEGAENYLVALCPEQSGNWTSGRVGLAGVELASGRFWAEVLPSAALADELGRIRPAELLIPEAGIETSDALVQRLGRDLEATITTRPTHAFDAYLGERALCEHFGAASMAGFGFDRFDISLCAAAAVLDYLKETQKSVLGHILKIVPRESERSVAIDPIALRALEVERTIREGSREGSLLWAVDKTVNPMGARRLREWLCFPSRQAGEIRARQQVVAEFLEWPERLRAVRELLRETSDIERITARLGVGRASPRDMVGLGRTLERCDGLAEVLRSPNEGLACGGRGGGSATGTAEQPSDGGAGGAAALRHAATGGSGGSDLLTEIAETLGGHRELAGFLLRALKEDAPPVLREAGFIADGYDAELDRLRNVGKEGDKWLAEFQARESRRTAIPSLKVGYNSVFGYYIEITHQHRGKAPAEYVRKQTVRNAERYITDELKRHETEVLGAAERAKQREIELFEGIREKAAGHMPRLQATGQSAAVLDVLAGFAELARQRDYCRPELVERMAEEGGDNATEKAGEESPVTSLEPLPVGEFRGAQRSRAEDGPARLDRGETGGSETVPAVSRENGSAGASPSLGRPESTEQPRRCSSTAASGEVLEIVDGRHPVLDATMNERFVPNDCRMEPGGDQFLIITGPNMAGKSTYIRQVALLVLLAQAGSYVPARSMRWAPVDRIFARVGASDELARGHSTFMVEMVETARILHNATGQSLVILDEIGRGTSTYDGLALAWAITEHVARQIGCRTLFATHYHELTELGGRLPGVANYNVAVREELRPQGAGRDVVFLHKIVPGATDRSYGVHVAAMAGMPASVLRRSEIVLAELERAFARRPLSECAGTEKSGAGQRTGVTTSRSGSWDKSGQMLLFSEPEPMPNWWREVVDALDAVDVDRTAPVDALMLLRRLREIVRGGS